MKIICQNCFEILADRSGDTFRYDPYEVEAIMQELSEDSTLITLSCPKCGCMVQVKA